MERPRACIVWVGGTNCHEETAHAFTISGGDAEKVTTNQLLWGEKKLEDYQILVLSGGFSYRDDIRSGAVQSHELVVGLQQPLEDFVNKRRGHVVGICNGFQVLEACGLLPFGKVNSPTTMDQVDAALVNNDVGHFRCDWVNLTVRKDGPFKFIDEMPDSAKCMVAHGEGKFYTPSPTLEQIEAQKLVLFRYADRLGNPTQEYPANPNGSLNAIAGICDPSGRIIGLMPHFERFVYWSQYVNHRREPKNGEPHGLIFFKSIVQAALRS